MANRNFTQFEIQSPLNITDFLVGFKADESEEIKTQLKDIQDVVVGDSLNRLSAIEDAFDIISPAEYFPPIAILNATPSLPLTVEVGTNINPDLTVDFDRQDAGLPTAFQLLRNNLLLQSEAGPFQLNINEIATEGTTTYTGRVVHEATINPDQIKLNVLGLPSFTNIIPAGTVSTSRSYTGRYRIYFGSVSSIPYGNLRTLPPSAPVFDNTNIVDAPVITQNTIVLAIPSFKNLQSAITQSNENITQNLVQNLQNVSINDANGVAVSYKLYTSTTVAPLNIPIRFTLT